MICQEIIFANIVIYASKKIVPTQICANIASLPPLTKLISGTA